MATMNIDIKSLSRLMKEVRENEERFAEARGAALTREDYNEALRAELEDSSHLWRKAATRTANDLLADLRCAASAAYTYGATDAQISLIMKLAIQNNDFFRLSGGRLTKADASNIIDSFKK